MSALLCAESAPSPVRYSDHALLTISGLTSACPSVLLRVLDALVVLGGVPTEIQVRRARASFRFHLLVAADAGEERVGNRLGAIVGVRCVRVAKGSHRAHFVESGRHDQLAPSPCPVRRHADRS